MSSPVPSSASSDAPRRDGARESTVRFDDLGVPVELVESLHRRGIAAPFPIQAATIPPALDGRDVCGRAPTGSGKTLAFGIPLMQRVARARPHRPRALVLAPTRELAAQIADELVQLRADSDQTVACFYGGVGMGKQIAALRRGVDVAVACPGRLADLVAQREIHLDEVDLVVLDEADRMADMGFLPEVTRLLDACATPRQTLLFSATLDGDVDVLIRRYLRNPVRHDEAGADEDGDTAEHLFWSVERTERVDLVARVVARTGPTVVFCRTKRGADRVARQLGTRGVAAVAIHGDRSQSQRERALEDFRSGRARAIVATDVAARGIHVDGVACVVHFDPSADGKDYVHRSGRTGRAGAEGVVISLVDGAQRRDLVGQQRDLGRRISVDRPELDSLPEGEPFDPPAARPAQPRSAGSGQGGGQGRGAARPGRPRNRRKGGGGGRGKGTGSGGPRRTTASEATSGNGSGDGGSKGGRSQPNQGGAGGGRAGGNRRGTPKGRGPSKGGSSGSGGRSGAGRARSAASGAAR